MELLVVVTVIVVLLALLMPAMSRSVYQAQLAICAANLDAIGGGVTMYTLDHKRYYPYRKLVREFDGYEISPMNLLSSNTTPAYDDRDAAKGYVQVNKMLNDPLCVAVDMENLSDPNGRYVIYSAYALWYGWQYRPNMGQGRVPRNGMFKLGDRLQYDDTESSILAGDYSRDRLAGFEAASHPDKNNAWTNVVWQDQDNPWAGGLPGGVSGYVTWSFWGQTSNRGAIDLNFAMTDGAVRRYNNVVDFAPAGVTTLPLFVEPNQYPTRFISVPPN